MPVVGWVDTDEDLLKWPDGARDTEGIAPYLQAAHEQCLAFLPPVDVEPLPDPIPGRFVLAQLLQARALYRSAIAGSNDQIGPDGMSVTVFPMDWTVKNLLRPRRVGRVL